MIFNFNKFLRMNENVSNLKIGDYVFISDQTDDIDSFISPWEGSYGVIVDYTVYDDSDVYLVKLLSEITDELRCIIDEENKNNIISNNNDDEIWVVVDYLTKYKSIDDLEIAAYNFKNKHVIKKYNL